MRRGLAAILIPGLLAACSGGVPMQPTPASPTMTPTPSPTVPAQPTPSPTATLEPRPTATPAPTIAYDCPLLTADEVVAIVGQELRNAYQTERGGCWWNFEPGAAATEVPAVDLNVSPWDSAVFNSNYPSVPAEHRLANVGDGAYWDDRGFLVFLYRDHVCGVRLFSLSESEADQIQLSIDIAQAAIPRMFTE